MPPETGSTTLVIVTGSGRSGTSTVAGALKKLGLLVPQPEVAANSSNPRGFFEPRWAVDFHKRVLGEAGVRTLDGRPEATTLMEAVTSRADLHAELTGWLATHLDGPQIVVKDPRALWLHDLWVSVTADLGVRTVFLTMLRHPPEVVGSRDMHYLTSAADGHRRARETANIAGWVNVALVNERLTRADTRSFVHYSALIEAWRTTMTQAGDQLALTYDTDLSLGEPHEIDDFIDPTLRRAQIGWDDIDVPPALREIAERVWSALDTLSREPHDAAARTRLDEARTEYDAMFTYAVAMTQDHTNHAVELTRKRVRRRVTRELTAQQAEHPQQGGVASVAQRVARRVRSARKGS